ncbi:MAG: hypothetical protein ROO76_10100 [Terriglobia bacterium]|nr:hypothetical protein [Terriglobia bacterium]
MLIEAKSYPEEMWNERGSGATGDARNQIAASLAKANRWFGADPKADWMGRYYQYANRLAYLYFFREIVCIPTWLINVCFVDDPRTPTPESSWRIAINQTETSLGLTKRPLHVATVFLKALGGELFDRLPSAGTRQELPSDATEQHVWRFWSSQGGGLPQFWAFYDRNGSSSMRIFNAYTGLRLGQPRRARGQGFRIAYQYQLRASTQVEGPSTVDLTRIPNDDLRRMQEIVGIHVDSATAPLDSPSSLLQGVDDFVDSHFGVAEIGRTSPHYKHLASYRRVAGYSNIDGHALLIGMFHLIEANWPRCACRGEQNWRWRKVLEIDEKNESAEKIFEKAIARDTGDDWVNMVPVASGVMPDINEGGRRIDLVHRFAPAEYEFIELKLGANSQTPLRAAIEILEYGLIYIFSRKFIEGLGYDRDNGLLNAKKVVLSVVAPALSYVPGSLCSLELALNEAMPKLLAEINVPIEMSFRFYMLPGIVTWPMGAASALDTMNTRVAVYEGHSRQA